MKQYVLAFIGFFSLFSFDIFADSNYQKRDCDGFLRDSLIIYSNNDIEDNSLPWRKSRDFYAETSNNPLGYIMSWESYLTCIKQEGKVTEAEIQRTEEYVDYLKQDHDEYMEQYQQVQEVEVQTEEWTMYCDDHLMLSFYGNKLNGLMRVRNLCPVH